MSSERAMCGAIPASKDVGCRIPGNLSIEQQRSGRVRADVGIGHR